SLHSSTAHFSAFCNSLHRRHSFCSTHSLMLGFASRSSHLSTPLATSSLVIRSKFPRSARPFSPSEAYLCCKANSSGFGSLRSFLLFWRLRFDACLNPRQV